MENELKIHNFRRNSVRNFEKVSHFSLIFSFWSCLVNASTLSQFSLFVMSLADMVLVQSEHSNGVIYKDL